MVAFTKIPADVRTPLLHQEQDNTAAQQSAPSFSVVVIAGVLPSGTAVEGDLNIVTSPGQAELLGGFGSQFEKMAEVHLENNTTVALKMLAVAEPVGGSAGTKDVTITGALTADGNLSLYIGGERLQVAVVLASPTPTDVAAAVVAALGIDESTAVTLKSKFPVIASNVAGVITFDARQKGEEFNDIDIAVNLAGESLPPGIGVTGLGRLTTGTGNPDITTALATILDEEFNQLVTGYTDLTNLDALRDFFNDDTGRWSDGQQLYGHGFSLQNKVFNDSITFGQTRNDQHFSNGTLKDSPTPAYIIASATVGQIAASVAVNPALPFQTLIVRGVLPPASADRFSRPERELLLKDGIFTYTVSPGGQLQIERIITSYREDSFGNNDLSYLNYNTLAITEFLMKDIKALIEGKFGRKILVDALSLGANNANVVTTNTIRAELIARYEQLETTTAMVDNVSAFGKLLQVERNATDNDRVDVLYTPGLSGALRILALRNQFRTSVQLGQAAA